MKTRDVLAVFNRGRISRYAMARQDVSRVALSADVQTNWLPRTLGSMSLRPGTKYRHEFVNDQVYIPFVTSNDDKEIIVMGPGFMSIMSDGETLLEREAVSTTITNGTFTTDLSGWTDDDEAGSTSTWETGSYMQLLSDGAGKAIRSQQVTVSGGDIGTPHALRISINKGPVILRVGTSAGADDVFRQTVLREGLHSIAFTPDADFYVQFSSSLTYPVRVARCEIEASGQVSIVTPWATNEAARSIRWQQVSDVMFLASEGVHPYRIERRPNDSWSLVKYQPDDGPFLTENTENTTITPSDITGEITLTASTDVFKEGHEGAIFRLTSAGQTVTSNLSGGDQYTGPIRVIGINAERIKSILIEGTWTGELTLQRSIGDPGAWVDDDNISWTANVSTSVDDAENLDNQVVYYRIGFKPGDYTSGTATVTLSVDAGTAKGVVRITEVASATSATAFVIDDLGRAEATSNWAEGAWSEAEAYPEAVAMWEGRLWWTAAGRNYASVSDSINSFDPDYEGDAGPINRRVADGTSDVVNWILPLTRLAIGTDMSEYTVRSNSFDEPVTPSNYNVKSSTTKGSAGSPAHMADSRGYFVDRTRRKFYELSYNGQTFDFDALDLALLVPEIGDAGMGRFVIQKAPQFRVHVVRDDGTVAVLLRDPAEDVIAWVDVELPGGEVRDVTLIPGEDGDRVFYLVKRTIDGSVGYFHEEFILEEDCVGGTLNLQLDCHVTGTGDVTGLDHLEGETVAIWADGVDQGTGVVSGGAVAGQTGYTSWVAGLPYTATYKSAKLAQNMPDGTSLTQRSRVSDLALILVDTHAQGLEYGPDFTTMDSLPIIENGVAVDGDAVWDEYGEDMVTFPGEWSTDSRICLRATAPRPCTVVAAVMSIDRQPHG